MAMKNRIKKYLDANGITPYRLEKDAKIAHATAYSLYNNPDQIPAGTVLEKICSAYKIQPGELLEWVDDEV